MRAFAAALLLTLSLCSPRAPAAQGNRSADESERGGYAPPAPSKSVEIGNFYFRRKKYAGALSRYQEAATDDPYYAPAYLGLGQVYEKLGFREKALAAYQKYLDLLPSERDAEEAKDAQRAIIRLRRQLHEESGRAPRAAKKGGD